MKITKAIPKLPFINKVETINFYTKKLNFLLLADYGDYFLIEKDQAEVHFFQHNALIPNQSDFMIYFLINEKIDKMYQNFISNSIEIHPNGALETKIWQQREFSILDPNGTLLTFGQSIL